jgi:hypothetical protein
MSREVLRKVVIAGAGIVTVLLLVFPPWIHSLQEGRMVVTRQGIHSPIYKQPDSVPSAVGQDDWVVAEDDFRVLWSIRIDSRRMANELGIVWVIAGFAYYMLRARKDTAL